MDNIRRQYAANAEGLATMLAKATATGRKVNGYTAEDLAAHVAEYRRLSTLDDAGLRAHFEIARRRAAEALGRMGGSARTAAKAIAARQNGHKGGRPRKTA